MNSSEALKKKKKEDPTLKALRALIRSMKRAEAHGYAKKMGVSKAAADEPEEESEGAEERPSAGGRSRSSAGAKEKKLADIVTAAVSKGKTGGR